MKAIILAAFALLSLGSQAHAWGDLGHNVICEIAFRLAQPTTREQIRKLIAEDKTYKSFSESCVYPDHPTPGHPRIRNDEHFLNLPRDSQGLTSDSCPQASACVLSAILKDTKVLASKSEPDAVRLIALESLGHWVGDIHQPLHVAFRDDRGGNDIPASGCRNLHIAWDTCLVKESVGTDVNKAATELMRTIDPADEEKWEASSPRDWANETFAVAEAPTTGYCNKHGLSCDPTGTDLTISINYIEANKPIVKQQLLKAGVRLAEVLDNALKN